MRWPFILSAVALGALLGACVVGERPSVDRIACADGECVCMAGFGNCDGDPNNGCESVLDVDPKNCGACGTVCVNGTCEAGACACSDGFFDCNGDPTDGCEALIRADPDNCGECGRSCLGGDCSSSRCAPFLLAELGTYIYSLAANDTAVFFCDADSGVLYRVAKDEGTAEPLVLDQNCYEMAASNERLYWSVRENGEELIRAVPAEGGAATTIAVADSITSFAPQGMTILWSESNATATGYDLFKADALGSKTSLAQSTDTIRDIVAVGNRVFWVDGSTSADTNTIRTAPIAGGAAANLYTTEMMFTVEDIAVVGDYIYWQEHGEEEFQPKIYRARSTGGPPEELYVRNREVENLLGDATGLYWTEDQGDRWLSAPLEGGEVEVLAEFLDITLPVLGVDSLLWIDFPSHLFALRK